MAKKEQEGFYDRVYAVVRRVPRGRVTTYGRVAALAGSPRAARAVGYAMRASGRADDVPWQRVINAGGRLSIKWDPELRRLQRTLLEAEGVEFGPDDKCDLSRYLWEG